MTPPGRDNESDETSMSESSLQPPLAAIVRAAPDGFVILEAGGLIRDVNDAFCAMSGYSRAELVEMYVWDLDPDHQPDRVARITGGLSAGGTTRFQTRHRRRDGSLYDVDVALSHAEIDGRHVYVAFCRDVTERVRAERAVRESEERFALAMEASTDGLWDWDVESDAVYYSPAYWSMLGYDTVTLPPHLDSWLELIHPSDIDRALARNRACVEGHRESFEVEFRMRHADGGWRWILGRGKAVARTPDGRALRMVGTHTDITALKEKAAELQASELRFGRFFDRAPVLMSISEVETGLLLEVNQAFQDVLGFSREEAIGRTSIDLGYIKPYERAKLANCLAREGRVPGIELELWTVAGERVDCLYVGELLEFDGEQRLLSIGTDITERKQAERQLRESEERFRRLFENAPLGYQSLSIEGDLLELNETWSNLLGYSREEAIGRNFGEFLSPEHQSLFPKRFARFQEVGQVLGVEFDMVRKDGEPITVSFDGKIGRDERGEFRQTHCVLTDITGRKKAEAERRKLEAQLLQSRRMETVGRLAGGVAHDFNNKLAAILGNVELAMMDVGAGSGVHDSLVEIRDAAGRSAELIQQLLGFASKQAIAPTNVNLNDVISQQLRLVRRLIGEHIDLRWLPSARPLAVRIDPVQVDQIVTNLVVNARDAIEENGHITLETDMYALRDAQEAGARGLTAGDYVRLRVSDDGVGMDETVRSKVFDPFFTTKVQGRGTGLGLATVYGIARQNHGDIEVHSRVGVGTTFTLLLPAMVERPQREASSQARAARSSKLPGGDETILLVEDEAPILAVARRILESVGYHVLATDKPEEALSLAVRHDGDIDLLVTDVLMPGINGRELSERLLTARPGLKCLYMSGYSAQVLAQRGGGLADASFLQKPFGAEPLARKVREILDA